jgi:N-acetylmuramoyl-L-alanine amidase
MRWNSWKLLFAAVAVLCSGLAIAGFSAGSQSPSPPVQGSNAPQQAPVPTASPTAPQSAPVTESQRRAPEFFVMIDPSHGGYDNGADFGGKLLEKDITLKLARELRKELEDRSIASRLLRDSDTDLTLDRRAEITNEQRAGIYIALHAGRPGHGVRVYAPLLANVQQPVGRFLPWESAQAPALDRSNAAAQIIANELRKKDLVVAMLGSPIRPLNNITTPAVAVELAPEDADVQSLENPKRNSSIASAIASAVAQLRGQTGVPDARALGAWRGGGAHR